MGEMGELCCLLAGDAARADWEGASRAARMAVECLSVRPGGSWVCECGDGIALYQDGAQPELWLRVVMDAEAQQRRGKDPGAVATTSSR